MDCPKHLNYIYDGFLCPFSADGLIPLELANAKLADLNKKEQQKNCIPGGFFFVLLSSRFVQIFMKCLTYSPFPFPFQ